MDSNQIIEYLKTTPNNTNRAVLMTLLGDGEWNELLDYVFNTSYNTNVNMLANWGIKPGSSGEDGGRFPGEVMLQSVITQYTQAYDDDEDYVYGAAYTNFNEQVYNIEMGDKLKIYIEDDLWYELTIIRTNNEDDLADIVFFGASSNTNTLIYVPKDKSNIWFKSNTTTYNPPSAKVGATITVVKVK